MTQRGFTLIEIAIVLVIVGLLLGAVLRGQSLIESARVRNVINQQESIKTAFFAFQDRFHALPGDYALANANIPGIPQWGNGDGDGEIKGTESTLAWMHLSHAGFVTGAYTMNTATDPPGQANTPTNAFGGLVSLASDAEFLAAIGPRLNLKTGGKVPSTVAAEIDRKTDDGNPSTGLFRATGPAGTPATGCVAGTAWGLEQVDCAGAYLF
jgi:prepilin-type N-terminal cleavage/methylation domain-containing protein